VASDGEDFTLDGYRSLLERTLAAYPLAGFDVIADPGLAERRFCLLRHDIDVSPARALAVARIEAELGARSTYTVLLTGRFYNPFEPEVRDTLREIASLGHEIGLHFDAVWHGIEDEAELGAAIEWQAATLGRLLGRPEIRMFSFHDTNAFTMDCKAPVYAGLWNAYAGVLQSGCDYVSDSNGYWRFRSWSEVLDRRPERLYLLTHAEWWTGRAASPAGRICSAIEERSRSVWRRYRSNLADCGRDNRSDIPEALELLPRILEQEGDDLCRQWLSGSHPPALLALYLKVERRLRGFRPGLAEDSAEWGGLLAAASPPAATLRALREGVFAVARDGEVEAIRAHFCGLASLLAKLEAAR
jgi:hypothetical protein